MSQYETTLDKALFGEQVQKAMQQGSASTPRQPPLENYAYIEMIRVHVARAVYAIWNTKGHPADLWAIYTRVRDTLASDRGWSQGWTPPSKRTVDRRVNEAADSRFSKVTPIVAIKAGLYIPNPRQFEGRARTLLEALLEQ